MARNGAMGAASKAAKAAANVAAHPKTIPERGGKSRGRERVGSDSDNYERYK